MKSLKKIMFGFATGVIVTLAAGGAFFYNRNMQAQPLADVKITQISGKKITHSSIDYSQKDRFTFNTHADGEGSVSTEIPKIHIPEARAWMQKTHGLAAELIYIDRRIYGISYLHRWDYFILGGGPLISEKRFEGVKIQGQIWF